VRQWTHVMEGVLAITVHTEVCMTSLPRALQATTLHYTSTGKK